MSVELVPYKTLYGDNTVMVFSGVTPDLAADAVNDMIKSMADAVEDLEEGVTGPRGSKTFYGTVVTGTGSNISATVTGAQVGDAYQNTSTFYEYECTAENTWKYLGSLKGPAGQDGVTGWTEGSLVDGSNTLTDATSLYSATGMSGASITVGASWATGHTARVGITFAASSTFSYPSTWVCVGDDCSGGDFTFSQGSSYWLFIEKRPDATWMTCQKVPS